MMIGAFTFFLSNIYILIIFYAENYPKLIYSVTFITNVINGFGAGLYMAGLGTYMTLVTTERRLAFFLGMITSGFALGCSLSGIISIPMFILFETETIILILSGLSVMGVFPLCVLANIRLTEPLEPRFSSVSIRQD